MRGRIEAGAAIAALFLALGGFSASQHWGAGITAGFFALAALAILGAFANRLPGLHRLPWIGDPNLRAAISIDGIDGEALRVGRDRPRFALVHVWIRNKSRLDIQSGQVNLLMTEGIRRCKCDHRGKPLPTGQWMRPIMKGKDGDRSTYMDYWANTGPFPGRTNVAWWFKVGFRQPGTYRFRLLVGSDVLFEEFVVEETVTVGAAVDERRSRMEQLSEAIDIGEDLIEQLGEERTLDDAERARVDSFVDTAAVVVPEQFSPLFVAATDGGSPHELRAKVAALYEVRRRLSDEPERALAKP
jgi:hypothetical protein